MGRNKISIKKLESASQRTNTFSKRSKGIKKKAKELSIISDAQVLLLLRTTTGEYDLFHDENSSFDGVVQKFLNETQKNLEDSRSDDMDFLRKKFKLDSHTLNAISLLDHGTRPTDDEQQGSDQEMHLKNLKLEVSNLESKMGSLRNIYEIEKLETFDELTGMENSIMELLFMNDQQSRVSPSLAQNNPPMPLILPNYTGSVVNTGFNQHFHDMLQPANLPTNCMNTPAPPSPMFTGPHPDNDWSHTLQGNTGFDQQSQVSPSLAQNNPPMPLILPNYTGSVVNTGFDQHFHDMLQPANLPTNCMNTPAPPSFIFTGPHPDNDWSHTMWGWEIN